MGRIRDLKMINRQKIETMLISQPLQEEFSDFISNVPASRLKQNMIRVLLTYLSHECPTGLPEFMDDHFIDLVFLFDFLDNIETGSTKP